MIQLEPTCRTPIELRNFTISSAEINATPIVEVVDDFVPVDLDSADGLQVEVAGSSEVSVGEQSNGDFVPCRELSVHFCFVILQIVWLISFPFSPSLKIYGSFVFVVMALFPSWRASGNQVVGIVVFVSAVLALIFLVLEILRRMLATIVPIFAQQARCCVQNVSRSRFLAIVASLCFIPFFAHGTYFAFNIQGHPNYAMATLCLVGLVFNVNCNLVCCIWIAPSYATEHQFDPVLDEWYADSDVSSEDDVAENMRPTVVEI